MQIISTIKPLNNYQLECVFADGSIKIADLTEYLNAPAFKPLLEKREFDDVFNSSYFIEWKKYNIDLSADTLWHIGKYKIIG